MRYSKLKTDERNDWRKARTIVLQSQDPTIWVEEGGAETELWETMEAVYQYIKATLFMDDNPLRHLRKYFPDFTWEFYRVTKLEKLAPVISKADYIWTSDENIFWSEGIVTATEKTTANFRVLLYRPQPERYGSVQGLAEENEKLRSLIPNIRFVYSEQGKGTVIK